MTVERTVRPKFEESARTVGARSNLSAARSDGAVLWVAGDESATIERLIADSPDEPRRYGQQASVRLADFMRLSGVPEPDELQDTHRHPANCCPPGDDAAPMNSCGR